MNPRIAAQIAAVKREVALRKNVYPKWVASGRMKQDTADREIEAMTAALQTLLAVERWAAYTGVGAVADMSEIYRAARGDA